MTKQLTLGTGFEKYPKVTRGERFLDAMDHIDPRQASAYWSRRNIPRLARGGPLKDREMMLRIYFIQQ